MKRPKCATFRLASQWACAFAVAAIGPAADAQTLRVTPDPIGATRALVGVRSTGEAIPPLPVEALAPAPRTAPRGAPPGTGAGLMATRALPLEGEPASVRTRGLAPTVASVEAGPIWSGSDANAKCAAVIGAIRWGGQNGASTCGCRAGVRSATVNVEVGKLEASAAPERCTAACTQVAWTGQWWTTVPGAMSVCQLRWTPSEPPAATGIDTEQLTQVYGLLQSKVDQLGRLREERLERERRREEETKEIQGPSAVDVVDLLEGLHVDRSVPLSADDVLEIDPRVHRDGNPESGLYYYLPRRFDLAWSPETQYALTTIYGMAGPAGEGEVLMAARLETGVDARELALARALLIAYARRHVERDVMRIRELRPLPLAATSDVQLFGGAKSDFAVDPEKVSVQGLSDLLGAMDVSWSTDVRRLLNLESLLRTDAGIHGSVTLHVASSEAFERALPIEIQVADPETFGRIDFDRAGGWTNRTHYPIKLLDLHALLLSPTDQGALRKNDPVILSWALGGATIPPGGSVEWDGRLVPAWVDQHAKRAWVRYAVDGSCAACDDVTFDAKFIPPMPATRKVVVTTGDVFEATGAERIALQLRSPFLDSQRSRVVEQAPVFVTRDGAETELARLFLGERELSGAGAGEPFYELRVEVVMGDGSVRRSTSWTPSRDLDFLLGSASLERLLGPAPEPEAAAP
jgi:hypothetical protein